MSHQPRELKAILYSMLLAEKDYRHFNVFFSLDDMNSGKSQSIEYISQQKAILLCEKDVERRFSKQKLVNFSKFLDVSYLQHPNGRVSLISSITLKNSHGEKDKYSIKCFI